MIKGLRGANPPRENFAYVWSIIVSYYSKIRGLNTRPAGRMRPAKLFCAARGHVHELKNI